MVTVFGSPGRPVTAPKVFVEHTFSLCNSVLEFGSGDAQPRSHFGRMAFQPRFHIENEVAAMARQSDSNRPLKLFKNTIFILIKLYNKIKIIILFGFSKNIYFAYIASQVEKILFPFAEWFAW